MQVLVVDDEVVGRDMLAEALRRSGYDVLVAGTGDEAIAILRKTACQLVVSDWEMPGLDGIDLCRMIRGGGFGRYIYFIMLTAHDRSQDVIAGLDAGADDFVTKPFNPAEIAVRLRAGQRLLTLESAEMTIFALARLAESRDPETGAHLERIRHYCRILATKLAEREDFSDIVTGEFIRLIFLTSPLHDIGKVGIPDRVLLKPGRLSDDEFAIMEEHTTIGACTLEAAARQYPNVQFLSMARDIALTHHERFDGTGYPNGLKGTEIPLAGRIVALADVYDALTSRRVYKEAFTHQITKGIILDEDGTQFDPDVVRAFVDSEPDFLEVRRRYADVGPSKAVA